MDENNGSSFPTKIRADGVGPGPNDHYPGAEYRQHLWLQDERRSEQDCHGQRTTPTFFFYVNNAFVDSGTGIPRPRAPYNVYGTDVLREHARLQFRAESFNILNHPNLTGINTTVRFDAAGNPTGGFGAVN